MASRNSLRDLLGEISGPDERGGSGTVRLADLANQPLDSDEYNAALAATVLSSTPFGMSLPVLARQDEKLTTKDYPLFPFLVGAIRGGGTNAGIDSETDRYKNLIQRLAAQDPTWALLMASIGGVSTGAVGGVAATDRAAAAALGGLSGASQSSPTLSRQWHLR